jgi:DNA-binding MarR family transcriptional regulator
MASSTPHPALPADEPTAGELEQADELSRQMIRFLRLMTRAKSHFAKPGPDGIERAAYAILYTLVHDGPQRTSRLADALHSDISTVSRQSSALVQHGLVERQADPEDGRASLLAATVKGQRVFAEHRHLRNRWLAGVLAEWPEADRETLAALFERFNTDIEQSISLLAESSANCTTKGDNA